MFYRIKDFLEENWNAFEQRCEEAGENAEEVFEEFIKANDSPSNGSSDEKEFAELKIKISKATCHIGTGTDELALQLKTQTPYPGLGYPAVAKISIQKGYGQKWSEEILGITPEIIKRGGISDELDEIANSEEYITRVFVIVNRREGVDIEKAKIEPVKIDHKEDVRIACDDIPEYPKGSFIKPTFYAFSPFVAIRLADVQASRRIKGLTKSKTRYSEMFSYRNPDMRKFEKACLVRADYDRKSQ